MLVFIAGPFRGPTNFDIQQNVNRAEIISMYLAEREIAFICPHTMSRNLQGIGRDEYWLRMYKHLLSLCSCVITVPNWNKSEGAREEVKFAILLDIPVFHNMYDFDSWYHE